MIIVVRHRPGKQAGDGTVMGMGSAVTSASAGSVAVITMDDGKVNAFDDDLIDGVHAALDDAAGARAVVLAGREACSPAGST